MSDPSHNYTILMRFQSLCAKQVVETSNWKRLWKLSIPKKTKFFLWQSLHNVFPIKEVRL
uniref:Reverse transcriptase zinc-binding domain-containing protein n=1 Tax=Cajanus cajan TaxID=3821 RepID=A0A151RVH4_CAJCA|nr:hypothetical protein KK1_031888 [Cajanus cajan]